MIRRAVVLVWISCAPVFGQAQEAGGVHAELVLGFGVLVDADPRLTGALGSKEHGIGSASFLLSSRTRTQALVFQFDGTHISGTGTDSIVDLSYIRKTKSTRMSFNLSERRVPAGAADFDFDPSATRLGFDISNSDEGIRVRNLRASLSHGVGQIWGFDIGASLGQRLSDGIASQRVDYNRIEARANLRFSAVTSGSVSLEHSSRDDRNLASVDQQNAFSASLEHSFSERYKIVGQFGWRRASLKNQVRSGAEWELRIDQKRADATGFIGMSQRQFGSGRVNRVRLGYGRRTTDLRVEAWGGVAKLAEGRREFVARASIEANMPNGRINLSFDRQFAPSIETGEVRLATRAMATLQRDISARGTMSISLHHQKTDGTSTQADRRSQRFRAIYAYKVDRSWNVVAGAQRRVSDTGGQGKIGSNSVFLKLERRFSGGI